jgi:signal transduction histidine kinase
METGCQSRRHVDVNRRDNIYLRLIIPLGLTLLVAMLAAWAIAVKLLTDTIDRRLDDQLGHATEILAQGEFPFSQDLIGRLDRLIEARIALLDESGAVALSTIGEPDRDALHTLLHDAGTARDLSVSLSTAEAGDSTWRIAIRPLSQTRDSRYVAVAALASLDESRQAARNAAKLLGAAMFFVTVVLAWAGHYFTGLTRQSRLAGLGDLASRVAHEIRNPLTAIKMQLQLLEEKATPAEKDRLARLLNEIRRMEMIVESALTLGAPLSVQCRVLAAAEFVNDLADLMRPALVHRNIELRVTADDSTSVYADPDRLRQVLINLINNAAEELPRIRARDSTSGAMTSRAASRSDSGSA